MTHADAPWPTASARAWGSARLREAGIDSPADVRELLEFACGVDSQWTLPSYLEKEQEEIFRRCIAQRAERRPLQHVTGRMYFRSLTLIARPGVFVVRPETEVLASCAIDEARSCLSVNDTVRVVDLCTGSGALALAVATEVPGAHVWAVEREEAPAALAADNSAAIAPGRVSLVRGDATRGETLSELNGSVDVVVSNPPYVPADEMPTQPEAAADPRAALYGGSADGMAIPMGIMARAFDLLRPGGLFLMEHSPTQASRVREAARARGYVQAVTREDLVGRPRFLYARKPPQKMDIFVTQ